MKNKQYTDEHAEAGVKAELPEIETWPNQYEDYEIEIVMPEFTSVCPKTGLPDHGTLTLTYTPDKKCLELKSLKMYALAYRNLGIFQENVVNRMLADVVRAANPVDARVFGDWAARGGISTRITAAYQRKNKKNDIVGVAASRMRRLLPGLILVFAPWAGAASWTNGQAARAVIGQNSFSAHGGNLTPIGLSIANQQLYVADASRRVFSYDLAAVLSGSLDAPCAVCLASPTTSVPQAVPSSQARFATYQHAVVIADTANHRILFWRDTSLPSAANGPDLILSIPKPSELLSVALDADYLYAGDNASHRVLVWKLASLSSGQSPDATLGRDNQAPGAATISSPAALLADGRNLFVADAPNHRVLVFTMGDSVLSADKIVSTASQEKLPLAPGALITVRGDHLADNSDSAIDTGHDTLPTTLADTELLIDGRPVPLMAVSPQEIRAQVPYSLSYTANATVSLRWAKTRASAAIAMPVQTVSPAIFAFAAGAEPRTGVTLHAVDEDQPGSPVTTENPAEPGETLAIWASGLGVFAGSDTTQPPAGKPNEGSPLPVRAEVEAFVNDEPVEVVSAVLPPGAIGIYEVRILVPPNLPPNPSIRLQLREANAQSNVVSIPVRSSGSTIHN